MRLAHHIRVGSRRGRHVGSIRQIMIVKLIKTVALYLHGAAIFLLDAYSLLLIGLSGHPNLDWDGHVRYHLAITTTLTSLTILA